jgi:uncharacterized protein YacL
MEENSFYEKQNPIALPNASAVLILGIASIVGCCCYGIVGLIFAIIALVLAGNSRSLYQANPANYTESSYKNLNAGKICAIIGLVLSSLVVLSYVVIIAKFGWGVFTDPSPIYEYYGIPKPY